MHTLIPKYIHISLIICLQFVFGCATTGTDNIKEESKTSLRAPIEGIWTGEFDIGERGPYDFTAIHIDGNAYAYSQNAKAMCVGTVKLDGENYISKYVLFALDGGPFDWATITGKLKEENQIASHFVTLNGGDTGALNITYNSIYEIPSSLESTAGNWVYTDRDDLTTEFLIEANGTVDGIDSDNCEYLGYIDIINPSYNVYKVKLEVTECGSVSGEYDGVSFLQDDLMSVQIANEKYALFFAFDRK